MTSCGRMALAAALVLQLSGAPAGLAGEKPAAKAADPLMATMKGELARATKELAKAEPAPYFISYTVYDQNIEVLVASFGGLVNNTGMKRRHADVVMRVGSPALDNTHNQSRESGMTSGSLPIENNADAIAWTLWELTDREYKQAAPAYLNVKTNTAVRAEEEDKSPDFSMEAPRVNESATAAAPKFDHPAWEERLRRLSGAFRKYAEVYSAVVVLQVQSATSRMVSSEGTEITTPGASARLLIEAQTRADDGMELLRVETFQAPTPDELPGEEELLGKIEIVARDLQALRKAPVAEPFDGPAMLSGRAAAVFFHEVLGHRLEGHRQRDEEEGQTFTKKVGEEVLPKFLSVADDPTLRQYGSVKLAGSYSYDDEGQPAQRVEVIQNGVLKNFLTSRMPIKNFLKSNGHGRNQPGSMPTGRQGNLLVSSTNTVPDAELRKRLLEEVKKQKKPYGLFFDDVQGGFTLTTRSLPQAFQVLPVMVYRVYADGRPDELVRGVDIVGTPLAALTRIMVTGDSPQVFNGVCGAESGSVPVAAVAPAMLFSEMEVQKRAHSHSRPPILPPPGFETPPDDKNAAPKQGVKP
ncbi:MAG: peptidase U62 [Acidobacteriia bacterium]|nr:peptidase U62 [Terriglobia bacterium]